LHGSALRDDPLHVDPITSLLKSSGKIFGRGRPARPVAVPVTMTPSARKDSAARV
jgi:hypothetical protein